MKYLFCGVLIRKESAFWTSNAIISKSFEGKQGNALVDGSEYGVYKDGNLLEKVTISGGKGKTNYSFYDVNSSYTVKELKPAPGCELDNKTYNVDTTSVAKSTQEYNTVVIIGLSVIVY